MMYEEDGRNGHPFFIGSMIVYNSVKLFTNGLSVQERKYSVKNSEYGLRWNVFKLQ